MTHSPLTNQIRLSSQSSSRQGSRIDTFLIHHTASVSGRGDGIVNMMVNRTRQVSSNYVLGSDGYLWMVVDEDLRAWTSGATNDGGRGAAWDRRSITIEICNSSGAPNWDISEASITKAAQLLRDLRRRYGIKNVLGHRDLRNVPPPHGPASYPTYCPGPNTVQRILNREQELIRAEQAAAQPPINPNVKVEIGALVGVKNSVKAHRNAADAIAGRNATATYSAGNYYIFKISGAAVNISKTKGKAGGWVSIAAAGLQAPAPVEPPKPAPKPEEPKPTPPAPKPEPVEPPKPVEPAPTPPAPVEPPKPVEPTPTPKPEEPKPVDPKPDPETPAPVEPSPKPDPEVPTTPPVEPEKPVEPAPKPPVTPSKPKPTATQPLIVIIVIALGAVATWLLDRL